jgi:hypothetical protein
VLQLRDHPEEFTLAVRDLRPAAGEEIGIQLVLNRLDRDPLLLVIRVLTDEDVLDLTTD